MKEISVVIPCYNSSKSLSELLERLHVSLKALGVTYEIIFINDCSRDNTEDIARKIIDKF